jgi:hypothetical protein
MHHQRRLDATGGDHRLTMPGDAITTGDAMPRLDAPAMRSPAVRCRHRR